MKLSGTIDVDVPAGKAWDFVNDIGRFSSCLPGLEKVTQIDDRTFDGIIGATVGPISGKFSFRSTIVENAPPKAMVVRTEGTDSVTKSAMSGDLSLTLTELEGNRTQMAYYADVDIKGRLAILGDMVLRATATLLLEEFSRRLKRALEADVKSV
ncbi:MAG: SRPBCC family protein [Deltaproteobacteria bacterium]|nr:SRPBCC family protein [Deltaproteobacteria bacterium]